RFTEGEERLDELRREAELAARLGLSASWTDSVPLPFPVRGAVRVEGQGQFHPVRYLESMVERIAESAGHFFEHTRVRGIAEGTPCRVVSGAHSIRAGIVIEATHTPINRSLVLQGRMIPHMSYVLGLRLEGGPPRGLFWDVADPYHYLRSARIDGGDFLVVGGEDRKTGQERDPVARLEALLEYARRRFAVASVEWSWSQQVFDSTDGLPFIGQK